MNGPFQQVAIVGLGLIGGSIATALRSRHLAQRIVAFDRNQDAIDYAVRHEIVDAGLDSLRAAGDGSDLIVLAVPVLSFQEVFEGLQEVSCIMTDVGSVKSPVIEAAVRIFGTMPANLVPGHPIAGSETHGVAASNPDLFEHHKVILTPDEKTSSTALETVRRMWTALGARVMTMSSAHHDSVFAQTSHLPHLLAFALVDMLSMQGDSMEIFEYAAGGFRDFSRIAASDPVMWRDIFDANSDEILLILDKYLQELQQMRHLIAGGRTAEMESLLRRSKVARDYFSSLDQPGRQED